MHNLCTVLKILGFRRFFGPLLVDTANGDNVDNRSSPAKYTRFGSYFGKKSAQDFAAADALIKMGCLQTENRSKTPLFHKLRWAFPPGFPPAQKPKNAGAARGFGTYPLIHSPYYYYDIYYSATTRKG
ncbi:MAG: hypothetical protein IKM26_06835 [Clostridia bacterium]|nr:hypothetical protein [Clostridia bacterium]